VYRYGYDQCWLVIDRDRWTEKALTRVQQEARTKKIRIALSNPNFELWLLLHLSEVEGGKEMTSVAVKDRLRRALGGSYKKTNPPLEQLLVGIEAACQRAARLDGCDKQQQWPKNPGSRVYLLIRELRAAQRGSLTSFTQEHQILDVP